MKNFVYGELSYLLTGFLFQTHKELGIYRNEKQYGDYLEPLLIGSDINYIREFRFEERLVGKKVRCICDFIIDDRIILELKAKNFITKDDYFQLKRYLGTLNLKLGIIVNFRQYRLAPKRVLNKNY